MTKQELDKELARRMDEDMKSKGLSEYRIRQDPSLYPFTQSIVRQLERGEFSMKRIGELEDFLGIEITYIIREKK